MNEQKRKKNTVKGYVWLMLSAVFVAGVWFANFSMEPVKKKSVSEKKLQQGFIFPERVPLPQGVTLRNQNNEIVHSEQIKDKWQLIFPGYTFCPDVCPTTLNVLSKVYKELSEEEKRRVDFVLLSVDPKRDTPERLSEYLNFFNADFKGLTGTEKAIQKITFGMGVVYNRAMENDKDGNYAVDHTSKLFVYDPQGRRVAILNPSVNPGGTGFESQVVLADLRRILH
ncbi:MAG: SCO family protein [Pseudomonadota bacterium]